MAVAASGARSSWGFVCFGCFLCRFYRFLSWFSCRFWGCLFGRLLLYRFFSFFLSLLLSPGRFLRLSLPWSPSLSLRLSLGWSPCRSLTRSPSWSFSRSLLLLFCCFSSSFFRSVVFLAAPLPLSISFSCIFLPFLQFFVSTFGCHLVGLHLCLVWCLILCLLLSLLLPPLSLRRAWCRVLLFGFAGRLGRFVFAWCSLCSSGARGFSQCFRIL